MRFEFTTAGRIIFGTGVLREVAPALRGFGKRVLVITGRSSERASPLLEVLGKENIHWEQFAVAGEPRIDNVIAGVERFRAEQCEFVIGFGGGSPVDAAKAIAALAGNPGDLLEYLEVIGKAQPLPHPGAPCVAIPTTAGTGAEVTRNAVLASPAHRVKVSLRGPQLLPRLAVVDPELTVGLPPPVTAATGMDALTQLIEPFVSSRANPFTDALCREGLRCASRSLQRAYQHGEDITARTDMCVASLFGGLALANAGLGAVHGFAGPVGGMFPAPHGAVCAALLAPVMQANLQALRTRSPDSSALERYVELAQLLTGDANALPERAVAWVRHLQAQLGIPPLGAYGVREQDVTLLCEKAAAASSMKANPIPLTREELQGILQQALH